MPLLASTIALNLGLNYGGLRFSSSCCCVAGGVGVLVGGTGWGGPPARCSALVKQLVRVPPGRDQPTPPRTLASHPRTRSQGAVGGGERLHGRHAARRRHGSRGCDALLLHQASGRVERRGHDHRVPRALRRAGVSELRGGSRRRLRARRGASGTHAPACTQNGLLTPCCRPAPPPPLRLQLPVLQPLWRGAGLCARGHYC